MEAGETILEFRRADRDHEGSTGDGAAKEWCIVGRQQGGAAAAAAVVARAAASAQRSRSSGGGSGAGAESVVVGDASVAVSAVLETVLRALSDKSRGAYAIPADVAQHARRLFFQMRRALIDSLPADAVAAGEYDFTLRFDRINIVQHVVYSVND